MREARERLGFAVAEPVPSVGRALGEAHGAEGGEGGDHVHQAVHGGGEQCHRTGGEPGGNFNHKQEHRGYKRDAAGEPAQVGGPLSRDG